MLEGTKVVQRRRRRRWSVTVGLSVWISKPWANPDPHPKGHPYASPCVVTAPRSSTPQLDHITPCSTSIGHLAGGGSGLERRCGCWPESVLLGSLLDSAVSRSSYRLVCDLCNVWLRECVWEKDLNLQLWRKCSALAENKGRLVLQTLNLSFVVTYTAPHTHPQRTAPSLPPSVGNCLVAAAC